MNVKFRLRTFITLAATTVLLALAASNEVVAQRFGSNNAALYDGFGSDYHSAFIVRPNSYGYTGFGQGTYSFRPNLTYYDFPRSVGRSRSTVYYHGLFPQSQLQAPTYYQNRSRFYNPYGYGGFRRF
jgi:hypothetical protein